MNEYTYSEIKIGQEECFQSEITKEKIVKFSEISGDKNPLHLEEDYASHTKFKKPVVFGMLVSSFLSTLAGMYLPGKYSLIVSTECKFKKPCYEGDIITVTGKIEKKIEVYKIIVLSVFIENQKKEVLLEGKMSIQVLK